ncbi:hypothetical protein LCGC14_1560500 [marine sediment metagenome]|uniref:Uncharacterized protein n=1 Tax=marine sediment metagenome TaxID=412755 RepID=A0A0F9LND8_9ZZZZ
MTNIPVINLNGGEFTPKIDTRSDVEKYISGCRICQNMIPTIFGGVEKRPGTEFITSSAAFDTIIGGLVANDNVVVCWENNVVTTDFDSILSKILCWENDAVCWENDVVVSGSTTAFVSRIICHENNIVFYENETVRI